MTRKQYITHISVLFFFVSLSLSATAQKINPSKNSPISDKEQVHDMMNELSSKIDLSNQQYKELTKLYLSYLHFIEENREGQHSSTDRLIEKAKMDMRDKIKRILTKEQQKEMNLFLKYQRIE